MSYCRFYNTLEDLRDCQEHINDTSMGKEELEKRNRLVEICQEIVDEAEEIEEKDLEENEDD
jgi:hypothetical protein